MKKLFVLCVVAGLMGGCATESFVNEDGTRNWRGDLLWAGRDVFGWEAAEIDPYAGVEFEHPGELHPKAETDKIEYKDHIPQTWLRAQDHQAIEWGCEVITYEEYPHYKEYDITDCNWEGGGANRLYPELIKWNRDYRNHFVRDFRRNGRWIVALYKSYGDRIDESAETAE